MTLKRNRIVVPTECEIYTSNVGRNFEGTFKIWQKCSFVSNEVSNNNQLNAWQNNHMKL